MPNRLSFLLLVFAIASALLSGVLVYQRLAPIPVPIRTSVGNATSKFASPETLALPDLNINLPIIASQIHGSDWEYTSQGISYLVSSPKPGASGNSILYGHNWPNLLGNLNKAKTGQVIYIRYSDGTQQKFIINEIKEVAGSDVTILDPTTEPRITLYTCTGFLDSKRLVVIANPGI